MLDDALLDDGGHGTGGGGGGGDGALGVVGAEAGAGGVLVDGVEVGAGGAELAGYGGDDCCADVECFELFLEVGFCCIGCISGLLVGWRGVTWDR